MDIGKAFALLGTLFLLLSIVYNLNRSLPKIPGDILIDKFGFTIYIPWVSSLILSVILTLLLNSLNK